MNKLCKSCRLEKELAEFDRHPTCLFGRKNVCKSCASAYGKKRYAQKRELLGKKPRISFCVTVAKCQRIKGESRADGMLFWSKRRVASGFREWWVTKSHYDDLVLRMNTALSKYRNTRSSHIRNLARINTKTSIGRARNTRLQAIRRARKAACPVSDEPETRFLYSFCQAISRGSGVPHHVDHVKPLSSGGAHRTSNLRIIPAAANLKKGACIDGIRWVDTNNYKQLKRAGGY